VTDLPPLPQPEDTLRKVHLEITTECNLDCKMCIRQVWRESLRSMAQETFDAFVGQLRDIPTIHTVQFGGFGEPTAHPRFLEFLLAVKEAGCRAELVTNGVGLTSDVLKKLIDLGLDLVVVSLDQANHSGNGVLHYEPDCVKQNLRNLYREKFIRNATKPEVAIEFVATAANIEGLPDVKRLALSLGFERIIVTNLVPHTADQCDQILYQHWATARGSVKPSHWDPLIDLPRLDAWSKASRTIERLQRGGSNLAILGSAIGGDGIHCRFVGEGRAAIDPDGNVSPCLALLHNYEYFFRGQKRRVRAYSAGNVNQASLSAIWRDTSYERFRERVRRWGFSPCINCGGCELRDSNETDCFSNEFPCCGECLWAAGIVQCP
jgi:MoaA/NifB/PqqE/SkfB family radical SAM enzyme